MTGQELADKIKGIVAEAETAIASASDAAAIEAERVRWLGRERGTLSKAIEEIATLPRDERSVAGRAANEGKGRVESLLTNAAAGMKERAIASGLQESEDLTLPPRRVRIGRLHPVSRTIRDVSRIFGTMGFETIEGPEIDNDYYNFEALNIPPGHPAREKWDTLWIANPLGDDPAKPLLGRTHTSPMQVRVMEQRKPPIRVVIPGRCYRYEATDAIRESIFFQYEGLAIDEHLSMSDLKGVLYSFARQYFGTDKDVRFRPDYFPFTEPSAEIAFACFICEGKDPQCHTCGGDGWIEAAGCGMVHPNVLRRVGYDPDRYQGFAFGGGIERLAMLKTGTPDIRLLYQNDLRYLESV
ncbi:MAG TPA: phenylalanine--tRNA ligase subunit alpha [Candidatus Acidoferrales bacterium]|nr:phenylalanine--tRNA ligase subunit alpha [Candidatus Acidoferrales bacterium]